MVLEGTAILALGTAILTLGTTSLSAQQQGDGAWNRSRYEEVRTNLRLGVMLSWRERFDSALVFVGRARAAEPTNPEPRLIEARILAMAGRHDAAIARYDSLLRERPESRDAALGRARALSWSGRLVEAREAYDSILARHPDDEEAMVGTAQTSAWRGDLRSADRRYRAVIQRNPGNVDALIGLGYVFHWQGRSGAAERQARAALAIDSTSRPARELQEVAMTTARSTVGTSTTWSNDSDDNTSWWQTVAASSPVTDGVRALGSAGALRARDAVRDGTRVGGEAGLAVAAGKVQLAGSVGARHLDPDEGETRTAATYRARVSYRPVPKVGLGVGYSRAPFDETALLIERALDLESLEGNADLTLTPWLSASAGGGMTWFSDGNGRGSAIVGLTGSFRRRFFLGAVGRTLSYDRRGSGYFSPDRFSLLEAVGGYNLASKMWEGRFAGGLGAQRIGEQGEAQSEWHLEARLGRRWGMGNRVELFGLVTNSAVSSTNGAFRYRSAGVSVRIGL
jgi:tetratricopeptide (TPR) repeat protein